MRWFSERERDRELRLGEFLPLYLYVLALTQRMATTMMMITIEAAARRTTNHTVR